MSVKNFPNGVRLVPQADPPSNPREGQMYIDNGDNRSEGLYRYSGTLGWYLTDPLIKDKGYRIAIQSSGTVNMMPDDEIVSMTSATFNMLDPENYPGREIILTSAVNNPPIPTGPGTSKISLNNWQVSGNFKILRLVATPVFDPTINWVWMPTTFSDISTTKTLTVDVTSSSTSVTDLNFSSGTIETGTLYKLEIGMQRTFSLGNAISITMEAVLDNAGDISFLGIGSVSTEAFYAFSTSYFKISSPFFTGDINANVVIEGGTLLASSDRGDTFVKITKVNEDIPGKF